MNEQQRKRYRLRDLNIDRVDLVDRGANQHAHIVIAKGQPDMKDVKRDKIKGAMKERGNSDKPKEREKPMEGTGGKSEKPGMAGPLADGDNPIPDPDKETGDSVKEMMGVGEGAPDAKAPAPKGAPAPSDDEEPKRKPGKPRTSSEMQSQAEEAKRKFGKHMSGRHNQKDHGNDDDYEWYDSDEGPKRGPLKPGRGPKGRQRKDPNGLSAHGSWKGKSKKRTRDQLKAAYEMFHEVDPIPDRTPEQIAETREWMRRTQGQRLPSQPHYRDR